MEQDSEIQSFQNILLWNW